MEAMLLTVNDVCEALQIGRTNVYALIGSGSLRSVTIGSRRFVTRKALEEYVGSL